MHRMDSRCLGYAVLMHEMKKEMVEDESNGRFRFGPLMRGGEKVPFKESRKQFMRIVDEKRRKTIYEHECHLGCRERGCADITVFDGIHKIQFCTCMYDATTKYPESIADVLPQSCTEEPSTRDSAFCSKHEEIVRGQGWPTKLREFLKSCGTDPDQQSREGRKKVSEVLKNIAVKSTEGGASQVGEEQGIADLFNNDDLMVGQKLKPKDTNRVPCTKDLGATVRMRRYNRGLLSACSPGGHTWQFDPMWKSENPTQSLFLILKYLRKRLGNVDPDLWKEHTISYVKRWLFMILFQ